MLNLVGYIVSMHEKYDDDGKIVAYYYQLQEKLPLDKVFSLSHKSEDNEKLQKHYEVESTHWLAYWNSVCPLPDIARDDLLHHPIKVRCLASSTKYYERMQQPPLRNFRNINVDDISVFE